MMTRIVPALLLATLGLLGCASDQDPCAAAADHYAECTGGSLEGLCAVGTNDARVEEILSLSCDELTGADGKGDGSLGWRNLNDRCTFNFQCTGELVCRPANVFNNDLFCKELGTEFTRDGGSRWCGGFCDSDSDCATGLACQNANASSLAGMCLSPGHTAYDGVCIDG